jgi:chaperonin GroES
MKVRPLSDRVLVKPMAKDEITKSGIVIPDTVEKERPERGEIIAAGPGKINKDGSIQAMSVKIGDKIMFKKYGPDEVKIDGQDLLILEESDIIAVLED